MEELLGLRVELQIVPVARAHKLLCGWREGVEAQLGDAMCALARFGAAAADGRSTSASRHPELATQTASFSSKAAREDMQNCRAGIADITWV